MIGSWFYHETLKSATAAFGSLFNDISIKRRDGKIIPVPISYGPRSKWLEAANTTDDQEMFEKLLPRISYEMVAMTYDVNRKLTNKQMMVAQPTATHSHRVNVAVPYSLDFSLYIQTKNLNDGWQIVEQILPFFTPAYTVRVRHFPENIYNDSEVVSPENAYDMPVILNAITWADDYAGDMGSKRSVEWTLEFQTKIHLFGPSNGIPGVSNVIYDARGLIAMPVEIDQTIYDMDRTSPQEGGEAGYISIEDSAIRFNPAQVDDLSPFVINKLMDSDGNQIKIIREFEV